MASRAMNRRLMLLGLYRQRQPELVINTHSLLVGVTFRF
jgi:hypothetical protein